MNYIEPHAHMVSRTTDDYERLALAGCRVVCEPAFWAGFDRSSAQGFYDYFLQLTKYEPARAAQFGLRHFCWLCINPKEAEDTGLAREVIDMIPPLLHSPNVLGIGEIGLNKNSRNELKVFHWHVELAEKHNQLILVHTPHLEDKLKGTRLIIDALREHAGILPSRVIIDHVEEHTIRHVLDAGFWAGMTLYPKSKCSLSRAVDMIDCFGMDRLWMNSACDWGVSDPLAVPKATREMSIRGYDNIAIQRMVWSNPFSFMAQSDHFNVKDAVHE
ncbi:MAG TPA: TatD family hydrolase [Kiritimatiellia bacterium]|nr:TatD family hydrolase [Kiritimatiellia bacterium]